MTIFGGNVTDKVGNQKMLYNATSNNLCFCTTWENGKHKNHIFHTNAVLVESATVVGLYCMHNAVFLKEKLTSLMCLIASDIC